MGQENPLLHYSLVAAAVFLHVTPKTLQRWIKDGQIQARRILVSGSSYKLVISDKEILRYIDENWPTMDDLERPPKSPRAARIKRIIGAHRGHLGKALAAKKARSYGNLR